MSAGTSSTTPAGTSPSQSLLVIATDVVQAPNDKQQITPILEKVDALPQQLGRPETQLADNGYFSEANVMACAARPSVGSWRDPCSTGQNCELMDPSSDLIALWKNNSSKSSSTGQFAWPIQLANGYRDPHLLPTAMIRYMVVVLARPIFCGVQ
jgi:hypothetical protein